MTQPAKEAEEPESCYCAPRYQKAPHTCPYNEDIHNDSHTLCTCCSSCERECARDI